ncbi:MAG: SDR family NAD(P)-dependent oxidoreductase [Nitriliruptoraceae bacterium]|nr:SDR family NAD(P)-dependent oxidoreductase [Nitriliruptoraceae bacterium]
MTVLEGRRILVTGASSGIGAAIARAIADAGGRPGLLARRRDRLEALAAELDGVAVPADVVDPDATAAAVDRAAEALGGLDGLINAAGVMRVGSVLEMDPADCQLMFDVNVRGTLHAVRAAVPHLRRTDGARDIVNVSSMSGRRLGSATSGLYAASKAAVHMMSEGMRREFKDEGIRVSVLAPGFVRTELFEASGQDVSHLADRAAEVGLDAADVAASVVHALAAPPGMAHLELAVVSVEQ